MAEVFISYARKDGLNTARQLQKELEAAGMQVWIDIDCVPGGSAWTREIEYALDTLDIVLALLTPGSYESNICRAEHLHALRRGKYVIPVLVSPYFDVPLYLEGSNWREYPGQCAQLIADIRTRTGGARLSQQYRVTRYDTVPRLPQNYIPRSAALMALRDLVLREQEGSNVPVTAVTGMGGIGKTVLVNALCHDQLVQQAYPDGIVWITAGRESAVDFVTRMREAARALGDDLSAYDSPLACDNRYRTTLRQKAALVVVDDVWDVADIEKLLAASERSRFLFTTRDSGIAKVVAASEYRSDLVDQSQSRELLAKWSAVLTSDLPAVADEIIRECGRLPLALAVIGASLRDVGDQEWPDMLDLLRHADVSKIERQLPPGQKSFFRALQVSVLTLDPREQQLYRALAVLLEDMPSPPQLLARLWNVSESEARRISKMFVERSLAQRHERGSIRLHDLQLDYVRAQYPDREALNLIHGAMRLSSHVIDKDPQQMASQMTARLLPHFAAPAISRFVAELTHAVPGPWIRPLHASLHPPGLALIRSLVGHRLGINGIGVTEDGYWAVSGSEDTTIKTWDLESGRVLRTLEGHSGAVKAVVFTPDRRRVVSASADNTLKVWDSETGNPVRTLKGHAAAIRGVAVSPDGKQAVSASEDTTLRIWDLEKGHTLHILVGHSGPVRGVALTPDGKQAASASSDGTVKLWDVETGLELRTLRGHLRAVTALAISIDGRYLISASSDNTLAVWDLETGHIISRLAGHSGQVTAVAISPDRKRAVSASVDNTVRVWDLQSSRACCTLRGHSRAIAGLALLAKGRRAVSASADGTLKVWDLEAKDEASGFEGHIRSVWAVGLMGDGRYAVSGSADKMIIVWDLETGKAIRKLEGHRNVIRSLAIDSAGQWAISGSADNTLILWDLRSGVVLRRFEGHSRPVWCVAVTPDGRRAVSASSDGTLKVWQLDTGLAIRTLKGHSGGVRGVAVAPDGRTAVSGSADKTLKVWDLENGRLLRTLEGHAGWIRGVAVTPDGRRIVSGSKDTTIKIWDLDTGRMLHTLKGHVSWVFGIGLTSGGRRAVSASDDKTLRVWDLDTAEQVAIFTCDAPVYCCAAGYDQTIVAGDASGRVHFLTLEAGGPPLCR